MKVSLKNILGVFVLILVVLFTPRNVFAEEMSDEFKKILNKDGYLEVDSIPPTTFEQAGLLIGDYVLSVRTQGSFNVNPSSCNTDYTVCDIERYEDGRTVESHPVKILYQYDENIKKQVDEYAKRIEDKSSFNVRDMEVVNFWINAKGLEDLVKDYSSELKEYFDFKNFQFDIRMGDPGEFLRSTGGEGNIVYDGTIYYFGGFTEVVAKHILYVPKNTGDTKEELMKVIQQRIDNYVGKDIVEISYGGNVYDYFINNFDKDINEAKSELDLELAKPIEERDNNIINQLQGSLSNYEYYKTVFLNDWTNKDGYYGFLTQAEGGHYFYATIPGNSGDENVFKFIVVKDDEKMFEPSHITRDAKTDVIISSNDSSVPLDTIINAKELTSGNEYQKILEILNLTDNLTFDLKLHSNSLDKYITKLDNGEFEVKIPIPNNFKDKDLIVYYVDEKGNKEPYTVELDENKEYATFKTNHFSIYTLGYKETNSSKVKVTFDANGGSFDKDSIYVIDNWVAVMYDDLKAPTREGYKFKGYYTEKTGGTKFEMILNEAGIDNNSTFYAQWEKLSSIPQVPQTFDGISKYILISLVTLISMFTITVYLKKESK